MHYSFFHEKIRGSLSSTKTMKLMWNILSYLTDPLDSTDEVLTTLCNIYVTAVIEYIHETSCSTNICVHTLGKDSCFMLLQLRGGSRIFQRGVSRQWLYV